MAQEFPIDAHKLTELLSHPHGEPNFFRGTHYKLPAEDIKSFPDAGWDVRAKSAPEHRTLENLLKRNLADDTNGALGIGKKTMVLVGGEPTDTVLNRVEIYFEAGWSVQLYCFRDKGSEVSDSLRLKHGSSFQNLFLGGLAKNILKGETQGSVTLAGDSATRALVDTTTVCSSPSGASGEERFILMNLDDILGTLARSYSLYNKVQGAKSPINVGVDLKALTKLVCGNGSAKVQRQVAMHSEATTAQAQALLENGWALSKQTATMVPTVLSEFLTQLLAKDVTASSKTLVLVMGDQCLTVASKVVYSRILAEFLARRDPPLAGGVKQRVPERLCNPSQPSGD